MGEEGRKEGPVGAVADLSSDKSASSSFFDSGNRSLSAASTR